MFTGLVETTGVIVSLDQTGESARLVVGVGPMAAELEEGESVAVNGCCLTVTSRDAARHSARFDLLAQTLRVTNLGDLGAGALVNIERAMRIGDRFGGHLVQGHVDAVVTVTDWSRHGSDHRLEVAIPAEFRGLVIPKGSICLDGISLTAAEVAGDRVVCWIVPHTLEVTNLRACAPGRRLNVEFDMLGKFVREFMVKVKSE